MTVCAIVLAAGLGTRMRSTLPKVMHPVLGRPMVGWVLAAASEAGVGRAVVVVGHGRERVEAYLRGAGFEGMDLAFALQAEQLGTAHAVEQALPALGSEGRALILNGDLPNLPPALLSRLIALDDADPRLLSFVTTELDDPGGYGRVVRDDEATPQRIVEDRDCTPEQRCVREINVGVYLVNAAFLNEHLGRVAASGETAEFYLTELIERAAERGSLRALLEPDAPPLFGVNDRFQLSQAQTLAQRRVNAAWMRAGVTMLQPDSALIEHAVTLSPDITLGPGVHLRGHTHVESGAVIDAHAVLTDAHVGEGARVEASSVWRSANITGQADDADGLIGH